jgi:glutathione S-transferase
MTNVQGKRRLMPHYTALVSLAAVLLYFFFGTRVARARRTFGVKLPATTGNPDFERVYRVQMNTLEWMPTFLVPLWLFALYVSDLWAAGLGLVWIVGRALYYAGYSKATEKRLPGFAIQATACVVLLVGAAIGIVMRMAGA